MSRVYKIPPFQLAILAVSVLLTATIACRITASPATPTSRPTGSPEPTPTPKINIPEKVEYPSPNGRELGDANAPVTVEVFSDFQCPACQQYANSVEPKIVQQYVAAGKILYVYHHYPFLGEESEQAANASMCAAEQNLFWEYHDLLFANWNGENQGAFSNERLLAFAKTIPLDMSTFSTCFDQKRYQSEIDQDLASGQNKGISGVPSVFVNGTAITPGSFPSVKDIQKAVDQAIGQP